MDSFCKGHLHSSKSRVEAHFAPQMAKDGIKLKLADRMPNTYLSHRLMHLAKKHNKQHQMAETIFSSYWERAEDIGDVSVLVSLAESLSIPNAKEYITSSEDETEIRQQERKYASVGGVPHITFSPEGGKKVVVSGAQSSAYFRQIFSNFVA
eukprot:TRINITY_DN7160_c0_g1_i1.p1 TRINITY_DN7160_c0_g1~~TRINITY_DN7160_c0_g1_i1.p1  ORF type:complete len:152 (-),score=25.69 TRINITY_DN7160_c0_g1_i1:122-577(-)